MAYICTVVGSGCFVKYVKYARFNTPVCNIVKKRLTKFHSFLECSQLKLLKIFSLLRIVSWLGISRLAVGLRRIFGCISLFTVEVETVALAAV